ncbi:MAG: Flp pilus assembly complex ATPase component, partial [Deltaproteobacteria bacterium]|nr:Flp pilus assembly complex ATPase component [Deltaproteobacteria bacterium]
TLGIATESDIAHTLANQFGIPYINLKGIVIEPQVLRLIPESVARRHKVIPVSQDDNGLSVAMVDPLDVFAVDDIKKTTGFNIMPCVTAEKELVDAIEQYYGTADSVKDMVRKVEGADLELIKGEEDLPEKLEKIASEASIIQMVDLLIAQAAGEGASDLHIEPDEDTLRVRIRVDGHLHEASRHPLKLHPAIISRLKIMGDLNIAEKRIPQDGRFVLKVGQRDIDIRLSTLPIIFGEKAVLRLLDKSQGILKIEQLTPMEDTRELLDKTIRRPYGMILLTGPTGSGKTTTAYTLISILNNIAKNIVTVEDPVEYHIPVVNQLQVNPRAGITFANALRSILRQDPDIIMIGEIRDKETAEIAIHASLTGHLVISTLHTNSSIGAVSRLLDMGIEPFLISSAITSVVGQRLIRSVCGKCKKPYTPSPEVQAGLGIASEKAPTLYKEAGCPNCKGTGFKGRIGIYEVLSIDQELRELVLSKSDANHILNAARKKGFRPLREEGMRAVVEGYTTYEEILQATQEIE